MTFWHVRDHTIEHTTNPRRYLYSFPFTRTSRYNATYHTLEEVDTGTEPNPRGTRISSHLHQRDDVVELVAEYIIEVVDKTEAGGEAIGAQHILDALLRTYICHRATCEESMGEELKRRSCLLREEHSASDAKTYIAEDGTVEVQCICESSRASEIDLPDALTDGVVVEAADVEWS